MSWRSWLPVLRRVKTRLRVRRGQTWRLRLEALTDRMTKTRTRAIHLVMTHHPVLVHRHLRLSRHHPSRISRRSSWWHAGLRWWRVGRIDGKSDDFGRDEWVEGQALLQSQVLCWRLQWLEETCQESLQGWECRSLKGKNGGEEGEG